MKQVTKVVSVFLAFTAFSVSAQKVEIEWQELENYTDIDVSGSTLSREAEYRQEALQDIQKYFDFAAQNSLPEGYTLRVKMNDIDLHGNPMFNEWSALYNRTTKYFNYPELVFDYELTSDGVIVDSGSVRLEGDFINEFTLRNKPNVARFPFEKKLIRDWFNKDLKDTISRLASSAHI